ncbi:uncharacterized protein LAESUDRAFT_605613, partial [Laetiporus sulphureus 93-53]
DTAEAVLPAFLDPLLDYLYEALPPSIYNAVLQILAYAFSFFASMYTVIKDLATSPPSEWDAHVLLPPLVTLLAAYLALLSIYRTTGWMFRTTFWFVKWGVVISLLAAGSGWMLGNAYANGDIDIAGLFAGTGVLPALGGIIMHMLSGEGEGDGSKSSSSATKSSRSRPRKERGQRPKAWESWDKQHEWQYSEDAAAQEGGDENSASVQSVIGKIIGTVERNVKEGDWWEAGKHAADDSDERTEGEGKGADDDDGSSTSRRRRSK